MTRDEWDACAYLLENGWRADWDDNRDEAYFRLLQGFEAQAILAAIQALVEEGQRFLPAAAEIAAKARSLTEPSMPSWTEAWAAIERALVRQNPATLKEVHPLLAAFVEVEGFERLSMIEFYDPEYGPVRLRDLEARWNDFLERARERVQNGRALEAVGHRNGLPTKFDSTAVIGAVRERRQIGAGTDG